ncbi:MAG: O-antigen ligase family protein, partial [Rhodothermia bacterium]|nr:O-antigen ligase family protein [Rhodothermia bacterium]
LWGTDDDAGSAPVILTVPVLTVLWGALIWTGGRGAFVAALIGVVATMVLAPGRRWVLAGINTVALSVGSVIAVFMSAGRPELGWQGILSRMGGDVAGGFATGRLKFWSLAYENFAASPVFGLGPDAYRYMQPKIFGSHPHNVVLQFLTDYGVIGASVFGLMAVILLASILRKASDARGDIRPERIVAVSVLIAFLANSLLDGNLYHALPLMVVGTTVAIGLLPQSFSRFSGASAGLMAIRTGFTGATATVLAVFFVLYSTLLANFVAGPIPSESSPRAQLVRNVPMVTHGMTLETWIRAWSSEDPQVAIEWAHWAHEHSPEAYRFSSLEAKLLMDEGLYEAAREHAELALQSAGGRMRLAMTQSLQPIIDATESHSGQMLFQVEED